MDEEVKTEDGAIRVAAYYKWVQAGRIEGAALDHWLLAEAQARLAKVKAVAERYQRTWERWPTRTGCSTAVLRCLR